MDYPIWDLPMGGGLLMALVAVSHVIVSHFAVGGGLLIAVTETLAVRRNDPHLRELAKRTSLVLILLSSVYGAISGVGIWVVAGLISPGAISALLHTYVWGWAMEWVFFLVEIVAALVYYATWNRITKRAHLMVAWIYFVAAYMSLVIINGIITFMLTPGEWLATGAFWDGFLNPTYLSSTVLRTGITILMAVAFMVFSALKITEFHRPRVMRYLGWWLLAGVAISYAGYRAWEVALPDTVRGLFLGAAPSLAGLAATRSLVLWALAATLAVGALFLLLAPRAMRVGGAVVLAVAAFGFFGSYERLREGTRKPFLIHSHMFSNGLLVSEIEAINAQGVLARSGWAALGSDEPQDVGRRVFGVECAGCHTLDGYQSIRGPLPTSAEIFAVAADDPPGNAARVFRSECVRCHDDMSAAEMRDTLPTLDEMREDPEMVRDLARDMISGTLDELRDMGESYAAAPAGQVIDTAAMTYPFMPPFVGTADELEALAEYLVSLDDPIAADAPPASHAPPSPSSASTNGGSR